VQYSTAQYIAVQYSTAQYIAVQYSAVQLIREETDCVLGRRLCMKSEYVRRFFALSNVLESMILVSYDVSRSVNQTNLDFQPVSCKHTASFILVL
jgi:hypothetical protein